MAFDYNTLNQMTGLFNNLSSVQKHEILTVNSLQQVKDFIINKGDSYLLLDPNADTLYIKECDTIGKINIRSFALRETTDEIVNNTAPVSISKSEYEKLISRLNKLEGKNDASKPKEQPEFELN